ncbi:hypothetical protein [Selenomonas sp.]|uniref:hypothetical protein n=1 Tax=Selenomonas sp. TaxID=2053611 RepID=UPI0025E5B808|nr:hypothetical protein [Selenomonas sp.]MCI6085074.1 hypothetical protein [Selenomonas sp.]MDY3296127.1 hypothetical protein [Selenomonas sp.]MDY4416474.1 hypothetical protein [Selenomonas sp.]
MTTEELLTRDALTDEAFNRMMQTGLKQAKANESMDADTFFDQLTRRLYLTDDALRRRA